MQSLSTILNVPRYNPSIKLAQKSHRHGRRPLVIGHRGSVYQEPENTIASFLYTADLGADGVELDVFVLKCGTPIVFHGGGTDEKPGLLDEYCYEVKKCNGVNAIVGTEAYSNVIMDYTFEQVRTLFRLDPTAPAYSIIADATPKMKNDNDRHCSNANRIVIPSLEEVLLAIKSNCKDSFIIKIELKSPGTEEASLEVVDRVNMVHQCHFSSFDHNRIRKIRQLRPQTHSQRENGCLNGEQNGQHTTKQSSYVYESGALFSEHVPPNFIQIAIELGASEIQLRYDTCTTERIQMIHDAGLASMAWFRSAHTMMIECEKFDDVADEDAAMYATVLASGVQSMCVNKPDVLLHLLNNSAAC